MTKLFTQEFISQLSVYPFEKNWGRVFKPYLEEIQPTLQAAMQTIRSDYDAERHIPREAGLCMDLPWPRSRTGIRAYHCYGYCHVIATAILELAQLAMHRRNWFLVNGSLHTVVMDTDGVILDINSSNLPAAGVVQQVKEQCLPNGRIFTCAEEYISTHLHTFPLGQPKPMPAWTPHRVRLGDGFHSNAEERAAAGQENRFSERWPNRP